MKTLRSGESISLAFGWHVPEPKRWAWWAKATPFAALRDVPHRQNRTVVRFAVLTAAVGMLLLMTSTLLAADAELRIEPREKWSAVFGDSETTFSFELSSTEPFDGQVGWVLAAKKRTILRGEAPAAIDPDKPVTVTVPLRIPPVKEGLVFGAELTVSVHEGGSRKAAASLVRPLWIYARDPFLDRSQWLKDLQLTLYDPAGKTAAVFDKAHVPFRELRNTAALAELQEGLLVIGEGRFAGRPSGSGRGGLPTGGPRRAGAVLGGGPTARSTCRTAGRSRDLRLTPTKTSGCCPAGQGVPRA